MSRINPTARVSKEWISLWSPSLKSDITRICPSIVESRICPTESDCPTPRVSIACHGSGVRLSVRLSRISPSLCVFSLASSLESESKIRVSRICPTPYVILCFGRSFEHFHFSHLTLVCPS